MPCSTGDGIECVTGEASGGAGAVVAGVGAGIGKSNDGQSNGGCFRIGGGIGPGDDPV